MKNWRLSEPSHHSWINHCVISPQISMSMSKLQFVQKYNQSYSVFSYLLSYHKIVALNSQAMNCPNASDVYLPKTYWLKRWIANDVISQNLHRRFVDMWRFFDAQNVASTLQNFFPDVVSDGKRSRSEMSKTQCDVATVCVYVDQLSSLLLYHDENSGLDRDGQNQVLRK